MQGKQPLRKGWIAFGFGVTFVSIVTLIMLGPLVLVRYVAAVSSATHIHQGGLVIIYTIITVSGMFGGMVIAVAKGNLPYEFIPSDFNNGSC